jgi:ribosomal protein S18 acetylase RimI-like enzyme
VSVPAKTLRDLRESDEAAFPGRPSTFRRYLDGQTQGLRCVRVAESQGEFAGYVTLLWVAEDSVLRERHLPEISDLRVLPHFRRQGIASALMDDIEAMAATRSNEVGLNVGLHSGYGAAQRLYVLRGYVPDGSGALLEGRTVPEGSTIQLDDSPIVTLRMTKAVQQALRGAV